VLDTQGAGDLRKRLLREEDTAGGAGAKAWPAHPHLGRVCTPFPEMSVHAIRSRHQVLVLEQGTVVVDVAEYLDEGAVRGSVFCACKLRAPGMCWPDVGGVRLLAALACSSSVFPPVPPPLCLSPPLHLSSSFHPTSPTVRASPSLRLSSAMSCPHDR